ncbi:MAG TPA: aminotransferase class V-fold PLP-dependent enzyme [Bacteroidia bacterium]|jgi:selenocysteine lyase/cysteine desulfurase|nr:aminotransferase class V-fold PLP-dependent enzyme [Bacteroidia bacterium]
MSDRRKFLRQLGLSAGVLTVPAAFQPLFSRNLESDATKKLFDRVNSYTPAVAATDDDFWAWVREQFDITPAITNMNNGGVSPQPKPVQEAHINYYKYCNEAPSYYMWRELDKGREPLRRRLADLAGVLPEEVAINRNSTEGLNTIIFGLTLAAGDEVIVSKQDYPHMLNAWKQREKRDGIKLVWVDHVLPSSDDAALTKAYTDLFTDKTKVVHVTHIINWVGQILPVRKIADEAHKKNILVVCDSAHAFGHFDFTIPDLGCDFWATSLHKWLCAPFGSGMMWIKQEKIKDIWPLLSFGDPQSPDIKKFEDLGTRSFASEMAISAAIDFHLLIGTKRKEARLRYLKDYWVNKVKGLKGVTINTPLDAAHSCAIANIAIENLKPEDIEAKLMEKYRIHCVAINWENIHGARICPHVYTSLADLDNLVAGITEIVNGK